MNCSVEVPVASRARDPLTYPRIDSPSRRDGTIPRSAAPGADLQRGAARAPAPAASRAEETAAVESVPAVQLDGTRAVRYGAISSDAFSSYSAEDEAGGPVPNLTRCEANAGGAGGSSSESNSAFSSRTHTPSVSFFQPAVRSFV